VLAALAILLTTMISFSTNDPTDAPKWRIAIAMPIGNGSNRAFYSGIIA